MAVKNKKRVQKDSVNIKGEDVFKAIDDVANWLIRDGNPLAKQFTADVQDRVASADAAALTDKYLEDFQAAGNEKSKPNDRFIDKALNALPFLRAFLTKKQFLAFGNPAGKTQEQKIVEPLQKKAQEEQLEKEAIRKAQEALSKLNEKKMIDDLKNPESEIRKGLGPNWFSLWLAVFKEEQIALMLMRYYADNELAKLDELFKLEERYQQQVQSIQALIDEARSKKAPTEAPTSTPTPAPTPADLKIQQLSDQIEQTKSEIKALKEKYLETRTKSHEKQMKTIEEFDTKLDAILQREIENAPDAETKERLTQVKDEIKAKRDENKERADNTESVLDKAGHEARSFPEVMMGMKATMGEIHSLFEAKKTQQALPSNTEISSAFTGMQASLKETIKTQQEDLSKIKTEIANKASDLSKLETELKTPLEDLKNAEAEAKTKAEADTKVEETSAAVKNDEEASPAKPTSRGQSLESVKAQQVQLAAGEKLVIQAKGFEKTDESYNVKTESTSIKKQTTRDNHSSMLEDEEEADDKIEQVKDKNDPANDVKPSEAKSGKTNSNRNLHNSMLDDDDEDGEEEQVDKKSDQTSTIKSSDVISSKTNTNRNHHNVMLDDDDDDDLNAIDTKILARDNHKIDAGIKADKLSGANQTKVISDHEKQWEKKPSNLCAYPPTANRQDSRGKSKEPANSSENYNSRHL